MALNGIFRCTATPPHGSIDIALPVLYSVSWYIAWDDATAGDFILGVEIGV